MGSSLGSSCPPEELVRLKEIKKYFSVKKGFFSREISLVHAVDGVSFDIMHGETLGLVGESGCGKSTLGKIVIGLEQPTAGKIYFEGIEINSLKSDERKALKKRMQIIFQDPYSSLNPRKNIRSILTEPLDIHKIGTRAQRTEKVLQLLDDVGLRKDYLDRYPHEFSGGQRQRIGIARALALNPSLIVADEPVSALDVSIRSQVLNLLEDLQGKYGLTYLFISHDLSVVEHICDRVAVMYLGQVVEMGPKTAIYRNTLHPYTEALLSAVPVPDPKTHKKRIILEGDVPSPIDPPSGCRFHPRCRLRVDVCSEIVPPLHEMDPGHSAACHVRAPDPALLPSNDFLRVMADDPQFA